MSGVFGRSATDPHSCLIPTSSPSSFVLSTGSPISHPPPGGGSTSPTPGAINRPPGSYILPQPTHIRSHVGIAPPVWLSTSSRPIGSGSNLMSPGTSRVLSPPQPPPLPPPPPSPQLVPLKARLARSKSVASQFSSSPVPSGDRAHPQWDGYSARSRRAAFSQGGPSRSLREPLPSGDTDGVPTSFHANTDGECKPIEPVAHVPCTIAPGAFPPITHPRERNALTVCLASFVFLTVSIFITTLFSTLVLPLCLLACVVRRLGVWTARWFVQVICCQCDRPQMRVSSLHPIIGMVSRMRAGDLDRNQICQCMRDAHYPSLRPLTPAELRWLPALDLKQPKVSTEALCNSPHLYSPSNAPVIVICLRFGSPGLQLAKLREIIASRLLNRSSAASSLASSPRCSNVQQDKWTNPEQLRHRANSLVPPTDTLSRLTQCLTCLSTGYAWRECLAFRIEEHVVRVPSSCLPPNSSKSRRVPKLNRSSSSSEAFDPRAAGPGSRDQQPCPINVEAVVQSLSQLPMLINRPLWQAYLLEEFQETDVNEASDADSVTESDELDHTATKRTTDRSQYLSTKSNTYNRGVDGKLSAGCSSSSTSFVCRRSGSAGIGSLLIFRLHAALSDDCKALVHLLTNCLADLPSRVHSPKCAPANLVIGNDGTSDRKRRWRGQMSDSEERAKSHASSEMNNDCGTSARPATKPTVPQKSYVAKLHCHSSDPKAAPINELGLEQQNNNTNAPTSKPILTVSGSTATQECQTSLLPSPEDEDPEESEAAQWWYTFWSSSLATIATCCDLIRALVTGPAVILHKYFFTRADVGIWALRPTSFPEDRKLSPTRLPSLTTTTTTSDSLSPSEFIGNRLVYKCALLSLVKLSRVRQVTKASYSEIILSLLAGGLRAYHQTVGLKHPPDLLAFLSVEVPVLPGCSISALQNGSVQELNVQGCDASPCTGITRFLSHQHRLRHQLTTGSVHRHRKQQQHQNSQLQRHQADSLVETGLVGNEHRMVAMTAPPTTMNTLCPGRHVLADICLPINTEGMLPRLWETRQRLIELNNSVDPLCLAWARTILYTLMPHPLAGWIEANCGGSAKASVSVTGVEVVSPFTGHSKDQESHQTYQMPPTRRLAYMSLLASKSAEARSLRRRLRQRLPRGTSIYPPRLGTSFRALARHLTNANAGLVYIGGSPVVRIDTWMPSPRLDYCSPPVETIPTSSQTDLDSKWVVCRNLSVTFTTYAGQLSLTFSADRALDNDPNLDLILHAMRVQLRKMCRLLAGRHVTTPADRWLSQSSNIEPRSSATSAVNLSPSLNPNLVLHQDSAFSSQSSPPSASPSSSSPDPSPQKAPVTPSIADLRQSRRMRASPTAPLTDANNNTSSSESPRRQNRPPSGREHREPSALTNKSPNITWYAAAYECQSNQPTEQLQDRLRWVQQQLTDAATCTGPVRHRLTEQELGILRAEFCALLRELKQRCSLGSLGITTELGDLPSSEEILTARFTNGRSTVTAKHPAESSKMEMRRNKSDTFNSYATEGSALTIRPSPSKLPGTDGYVRQKNSTSLEGGDFDEDPDFYIEGFDDEEDDLEDEDLVVAAPETEVIEVPERSRSSPNRLVVPITQPAKTCSHASLAERLMPGRKSRQNPERKSQAADSRQSKKKRSSLINVHNRRRRSSRLSTDVTSFDLIPNRRGSLGATAGVSSADGLLAKLIKPAKLPSALFSGQNDSKRSRK
ncbi:hypothetical protein CSKR_104788 [Clonorchis sinensis]|uniref:Uncharacterized protein n=2 Tax=Clonorchis sinensis TaxID=79923 RepID=G7Y495_CLOSI|nr:hypothetical protein CSKR_104788 [Clonorchis sinensis]GAA47781.1 hypothetical protein CLF_100793 [Clonorchis sinensis]